MSTARIAPIEASYEYATSELFARVMPLGMAPLKLFRTMARSPRVLQRMFAGSLLDKGSIGMRDREIVILRTCARCGSEYEWGVHVALFSQRVGLSEQEIAATKNVAVGGETWPARDGALIALADELHEFASVSDPTWDSLTQHYADEQILELIALVGYYHTISFITNATRVELEEFAPRFSHAE